MKSILISALCGLAGGVIAVVVVIAILTGRAGMPDMITVHVGPAPVEIKRIVVLESGARPSGYYVRYRNDESTTCESVHFAIRAFRDGKLWQSWEAWDYAEVVPGADREAILQAFPAEAGQIPDLSGYEVKLEMLSGFRKE